MALLKVKIQLMHLIRLQTSYIAIWTRALFQIHGTSRKISHLYQR